MIAMSVWRIGTSGGRRRRRPGAAPIRKWAVREQQEAGLLAALGTSTPTRRSTSSTEARPEAQSEVPAYRLVRSGSGRTMEARGFGDITASRLVRLPRAWSGSGRTMEATGIGDRSTWKDLPNTTVTLALPSSRRAGQRTRRLGAAISKDWAAHKFSWRLRSPPRASVRRLHL